MSDNPTTIYDADAALDALLSALVGEDPDAGEVRMFDLPGDDDRGQWTLTTARFGPYCGKPGIQLTAPNGEVFIAVIEREGD